MRIRVPGTPFIFDLNGLMIAGMVVFAVGATGYGAGVLGAWPSGSTTESVFFGVALAGIALYAVGRFVQFLAILRNRRS